MWYLVKCTDTFNWFYIVCDTLRNRCKLIAVDLTEAEEKALIDSFSQGKPLPCYDQAKYAEWENEWFIWQEWAYETIWLAPRKYSKNEWDEIFDAIHLQYEWF